ncbi:MAG: 2-succinyl-5-enolpyruvyl-6-hydroxy-3-cyclohexene-1-carboxylic-acid synthase [Ignavibacteria bacterium]|nr:2-succinyl-5-enolpyruvyl-6-hydroxy-3-cyclohexene-1-carboxylic-acid synthase [Ignavibacteria bacterium]
MTVDGGFPNLNTLWARVFVNELARCGLRHAVISPGSRSTPLVLAFAAHPDITDHSVLDERAAGFFALGLAKGSGAPVAVLCTSGTAAANLLPAVCEASLARVPLLVLTADRPARLRDAGAPQTMDQARLFGTHTRCFRDMPQPSADEHALRALRSTACDALAHAAGDESGPVHLNFPFDKPLEPTAAPAGPGAVPPDLETRPGVGLRGRADGRPFAEHLRTPSRADDATVDRLEHLLRAHARILLVAGPDADGRDHREAVRRLSLAADIPVLAEAASQLRFDPARGALTITAGDLLFRSARLHDIGKPDLIIRLGAAPTTRALQDFIAECAALPQVFVAASHARLDPDHVPGLRVQASPADLFDRLAARFVPRVRSRIDEAWIRALLRADAAARAALRDALSTDDAPFPGHLHHRFVDALPAGTALFVSSSMPIRDLETFAHAENADIDVFCNRGVNGIDGVLSTALGVARARGGRTVALVGDIALLHDLDGLLAARNAGADLTIVLINNDGGEIFDLLPVRDFEPAHTKHFLTPHGMDFEALAAAFSLGYRRASSPRHFEAELRASLETTGVNILEVRTEIRGGKEWRAGILGRVSAEAERAYTESAASPVPAASAGVLALTTFAGGDASALPAVFLHGFTRSSASWRHVALLRPSTRPLLGIDLMGHGSSPVTDAVSDYTLDASSRLLAEALDRQGIERAHLVGYSMGGRAALHFALAHPARLASLTLVSASPGIEDDALREARRTADAARAADLERDGLEAFIHAWMAQPLFARQDGGDERRRREARRDRLANSARGLANSLRGMGQGSMDSLWDALPDLAMPVLLVAGESDTAYAAIATRMAGGISGAVLRVLPGIGHDVPGETPAELRALLDTFWDSLTHA